MKKLLTLVCFLLATMAAPAATMAAPLSCDSELQTFAAEGMLMRVSAKYVYKLPENSGDVDKSALDDGVEAYIDGTFAAVTQLRTEPAPDSSTNGGVSNGSLWRVTGAPQCVEEPQFNNAVTIYVPVLSDFNGVSDGWLIESRNWKNVNLNDLTVNAPDQVVKRLSVYFLEPQILNPDLPPFISDLTMAEPEPACFGGGISGVGVGDDARRFTTTSDNTDVVTSEQAKHEYGAFFANGMPLFDAPFLPSSYDNVAPETWYDFLYKDLKSTSTHAVAPGTVSANADIRVIDGPACSRIHYESIIELEGDADYFVYTLAIITWYRLRVEQNGQAYEGWFPENIRWIMIGFQGLQSITTHFDFTAYYINPVPQNDGQKAYFDNWNLLGELEANEAGVQTLASLNGFSRRPAPETCDLALPTRLESAPRARVIADALNLRETPSTTAAPLLGLGRNSIVRLNSISVCADGLRWWGASVSGGALGGEIVNGWVAEHDAATYYLEPVAESGASEFIARPTAVPPTATPTPLPLTNPTQPPAPTAAPTLAPTPTATDPIPG